MNFNHLAIQASDILTITENYQFELGRISDEIIREYGYKALIEFSNEIELIGGIRRTPATLRMYAYIFKVSKKLELPEDLTFDVCRKIVFSEDKLKYSQMAKDGATSREIIHALYEDEKD
jgi:hypothetical protein